MAFIAGIFNSLLFKPVLRPIFRILTGLIAIPAFRFVMRHCFPNKTFSREMQRDVELWFRGAVLLLAATANLEDFLFGWLPWHKSEDPWLTMFLRLLLAVGVVESMPDQDAFAIIHRGPPTIKLTSIAGWKQLWKRRHDVLRGIWVLHLKRSSPVFVIMTVIFGGPAGSGESNVGWVCYALAVVQYLIIGVMTDSGRIAKLLEEFDRSAAAIRKEIQAEQKAAE